MGTEDWGITVEVEDWAITVGVAVDITVGGTLEVTVKRIVVVIVGAVMVITMVSTGAWWAGYLHRVERPNHVTPGELGPQIGSKEPGAVGVDHLLQWQHRMEVRPTSRVQTKHGYLLGEQG